MRLTLQYHDVRSLAFGAAQLENGQLCVDADALRDALLQDPRHWQRRGQAGGCERELSDHVDLRRGPAALQSRARRRRLSGCAEWRRTKRFRRHPRLARSRVDGRGAGERTPLLNLRPPRSGEPFDRYAGLHHVVVLPTPAEGVAGDEWRNALRLTALRAGVFLARSVENAPEAEEVLELQPVGNDLPRVAYVYQLHSHQTPTVPGEPVLYGDNVRYLLPTILHPNEIVDGGLLPSYNGSVAPTYAVQNNDVVQKLYALHGKELNFVGVVVYVANQLPAERDRATLMASNLVKYTLNADGAVFTKSGGGAPNVDMALIADRCEELGVKTSLMVWETIDEGDSEDSSLFNSDRLDAIVSLGSSHFHFTFDRRGARDRRRRSRCGERARGDLQSVARRDRSARRKPLHRLPTLGR